MCPPEAFHCSSLHPGLACVQDVEECGRSGHEHGQMHIFPDV
jgi:hypothetical protein